MKTIPTTREELMDWAADNYDTPQVCEGTPAEALMAGWVNAMEHERGERMSDEDFVRFSFSEYDNMGYPR